ncbi:TerD family protein [Nocardia sp. NPDC057272]|uniref:TerD family protein n=1 Tax=Nocardia sp. NPDC057272 TaxID=3346079 RepID=UPI00364066C9
MSTSLSKGQNSPLTVHDVVVAVQIDAAADLSALLVTDEGKVRSDADFVFYNQPAGPGVRLQPTSPGRPSGLAVSLDQVPADVAQIRVVITLDDASATFGRIAAPSVFVTDGTGIRLYEYRIDGLTIESIVIAVEFYRRRGSWKVRAVGQGYAGGFAALATDHGVTVDDPPPPAHPATPDQSYPPPLPASAGYPPPPSATPPVSAGEVGLSKNRPVSLSKGQRVTLRKDGGVALTFIRMGLGWDPIRRGGLFGRRAIEIDLDAWVAMFADRNLVDVAYYGQLVSKDGSIRHQGDNLTGEGEGDDEVILVDLTRVPAHVTTLLFIVTSYQGHTFEKVVNAFCRLVDNTTDTELARYSLTGGMRCTAMAMAKVFRGDGDWQLQALGEGFDAKHPGEAVPLLGRFVTRG